MNQVNIESSYAVTDKTTGMSNISEPEAAMATECAEKPATDFLSVILGLPSADKVLLINELLKSIPEHDMVSAAVAELIDEPIYQLSLASKIYISKKKCTQFIQKYNCSFETFEQSIKNAPSEEFEKWDDFIIWQACRNFTIPVV